MQFVDLLLVVQIQPDHDGLTVPYAGAKILAEPEDKPWRLREFRVADPDGNQLRVFYGFGWELQEKPTGPPTSS